MCRNNLRGKPHCSPENFPGNLLFIRARSFAHFAKGIGIVTQSESGDWNGFEQAAGLLPPARSSLPEGIKRSRYYKMPVTAVQLGLVKVEKKKKKIPVSVDGK